MTTIPIKVDSISFDDLRTLFKKKIFAIPDIQREFAWTKKKILASNVIPHDRCVLQKGAVDEQFKRFRVKRIEMMQRDIISLVGKKYVED